MGCTPLHAAAFNGLAGVVSVLFEKQGVDVNRADEVSGLSCVVVHVFLEPCAANVCSRTAQNSS